MINRSFVLLAFLAVPSLVAGCAGAEVDDVGATEEPLAISPVRPPGGPVVIKPIVGPTYAPPVTLPAYFDAGARTATTVSLGWYENVVNPHTQVWRQNYDIDENPIGSPTLIKTMNGLPVGPTSFVDSALTNDDHSAPQADRLNCYQVVETTGDCNASPGGPDCVRTSNACAYTRSAVPHQIGRIQLRIKVGSNSGNGAPSNDHIQVRLQSPTMPYATLPQPRNNSTWIDSTKTDFGAGSNITYDLKNTNISDLSDITMITVANPWSDDLCVSELELIADNTSVFSKSWGGTCAPTLNSNDSLNGKLVNVPFGELRRASSWTNFNPPNLALGISSTPKSFVGFRPAELVSYLDTAMGDALKNPAAGLGDDAGLVDGSQTYLTQLSLTRLRVTQNIVAKDEGWEGDVSAIVWYELAIHTDAATCGGMNSCIKIENVQSDSSFSGWSTFIPILGGLVQAVVDNAANGEIQNSINAMGASNLGVPAANTGFCFPSGLPGRIETPFSSLGFGAGSLTACFSTAF